MADIDFSEQEKTRLLEKMDAGAARDYIKRHRVSELERKIVVPLREQYVRENHLDPTKKELAAATEAFRARQEALRLRQDEERRKLEEQISSGELSDTERTQAERRLEEISRSARIEADAERRRAESVKDLERLEARRKELQINLESRDLSPKERDRLSDELGRLDQAISLTSRLCKDTPESLADMMVASWKFQKSLYKRYDGEVIHQQLGIEAVGAMRKWLEEHEAAGDFAIVDPQLRKDFWDYYIRKDHPASAGEPDPFRTPPWLEDFPDTAPSER